MGLIGGSHFAKTNLRSNPVETNYGKVVGKKFPVGDGRYADAFMGIPFAMPPVGELRFKKPQPPAKWDGTRECVEHGPRCQQNGIFLERLGPMVRTSEDCLYLNVFTPEWEIPNDQPNGRAVLVYIHGGGFAIHSSANYGDLNICRTLCIRDVVVVTIQYRLGVLGFCATGDDNSVPNLGLWDQAMALRWIRENIAHFSGNPDNITVFGQSAGAASVDFLCLSPYANGLFSKAIPMGGSASCDWAMADIKDVRDATADFARKLGWKAPKKASIHEINKDMMQFLKKQPSKRLGIGLTATKRTESNPYGMYFVPVIDGDFLPEPIEELRKKAPKKLCMIGTTDYEGLLFVGLERRHYGLKKLRKLIPRILTTMKVDNYEEMKERALSLYFTDDETKKKKQKDRTYVRVLSDYFINNGVHEFAQSMTMAGHTVYLYSFIYANPKAFGILGILFPFKAATHTMELPYLFNKALVANFKPNAEDKKIIERFTTLFSNFAIYGDPNGKATEKFWDPLTVENTYKYLCIDRDLSMKENYENRRAEFWRELRARRAFADAA